MEDTDDPDGFTIDTVEHAVGSSREHACTGKQVLGASAQCRELAQLIDVFPQCLDIPSGSSLTPSPNSPADDGSQVAPRGGREFQVYQ